LTPWHCNPSIEETKTLIRNGLYIELKTLVMTREEVVNIDNLIGTPLVVSVWLNDAD
jgi:hypothetical protein